MKIKLNKKKLASLILSLSACTGTFMYYYLSGDNEQSTPAVKEQAPPQFFIDGIAQLQSKMEELQTAINKPQKELDLSGIINQVNQVTIDIANLNKRSTHQLEKIINKSTLKLSNQLTSIDTVIKRLDKKESPIQYVSPKNLPFKVLSIDSIQQIPVVSVDYDFKVIPLEKNDSLASWELREINFGKQTALFVNIKKEHVLLTQKDIG